MFKANWRVCGVAGNSIVSVKGKKGGWLQTRITDYDSFRSAALSSGWRGGGGSWRPTTRRAAGRGGGGGRRWRSGAQAGSGDVRWRWRHARWTFTPPPPPRLRRASAAGARRLRQRVAYLHDVLTGRGACSAVQACYRGRRGLLSTREVQSRWKDTEKQTALEKPRIWLCEPCPSQ